MRKIVTSIILLMIGFSLIGCDGNTEILDKIADHVTITYGEGDAYNKVTQDIRLPLAVTEYPEASISWESKNTSVIKIEAGTGLVYRQSSDTWVDLSFKVTYNDLSGTYEQKVQVLASTSDDKTPPVLSGLKDLSYVIGTAVPEANSTFFLGHVTAADAVDGDVTNRITVDTSKVNYEVAGKYDVTYRVTDKSNNHTSQIIKLDVSGSGSDYNEAVFKFSTSGSNLTTSFSDMVQNPTINNSLSGTMSISGSSRVAKNDTDENLKMSGSDKRDASAVGLLVMPFGKNIRKLVFTAKAWGSYDINEITAFRLEVQNGSAWDTVLDMKPSLATADYTYNINISSGQTFRLYLIGTAPTGTGNNGARIIISLIEAYS